MAPWDLLVFDLVIGRGVRFSERNHFGNNIAVSIQDPFLPLQYRTLLETLFKHICVFFFSGRRVALVCQTKRPRDDRKNGSRGASEMIMHTALKLMIVEDP